MRLRRVLAILTSLSLLLAACGGDGGGVGTGGTGGYAAGPITGFGSVIVADIAFDDGAAEVRDGDDGARSRDELRLGMTVEIDSETIDAGRARATRIRFDSALLGPVDGVDGAGGRLAMLGQTVTVDETTVFGPLARLALLAPRGWVEVYALYDAEQQRFRATRIEAAVQRPLARVRGFVAQLDRRSQTFRIGGATFDYANAAAAPADLADGQFVRLRVDPTAIAPGRYAVQTLVPGLRSVADLDRAVVKGLVTSFVSTASFAVDGRPVDAGAASFEGTPARGARVEVEGSVRGGVLRARSVKVRTDQQERERGFELRGAIESVGATLPRSFVVRGVTVTTGRADLRFDNGSAADLAVGKRVEVRGLLAQDGAELEATRIKFE